jgi:hypothetical protein
MVSSIADRGLDSAETSAETAGKRGVAREGSFQRKSGEAIGSKGVEVRKENIGRLGWEIRPNGR